MYILLIQLKMKMKMIIKKVIIINLKYHALFTLNFVLPPFHLSAREVPHVLIK